MEIMLEAIVAQSWVDISILEHFMEMGHTKTVVAGKAFSGCGEVNALHASGVIAKLP